MNSRASWILKVEPPGGSQVRRVEETKLTQDCRIKLSADFGTKGRLLHQEH